ncbi:MAG: hypothetical protein U0575_11350 [Phycisphaerales bacterium]
MPCCCACIGSNLGRFAIAIAAAALVGGAVAATALRDDKAPTAPARPAAPTAPAAPAAPAGAKPAAPGTATPPAAPTPPTAPKPGTFVGDPYPFDTCPISGEKLDAKAVVYVLDGRELKFCCTKCIEKFNADPAKNLAELDKKIVAMQRPFYPLNSCVVMPDDELVDGDAVDIVWNNRLVRFCCKGCLKKFNADPAKFTAKLDEAVIAAQRAGYKLETCPISGEKLGAMGAPVEMVVNNRLVKLCCKSCVSGVKKNPAAVFAKLDATNAPNAPNAPNASK